MKDYYEILDVDVTATAKEIKKAYQKLARKYHPDRLHGRDPEELAQAEEQFKLVEEAYRILKDPINRAHFDQTGEGKMPKTKEMAVAKLIDLFAKHIKEALEKEMAMESLGTAYGMGRLALSGMTSGIDNVLDSVRGTLQKEIEQAASAIKNLEKGVTKLNSVKRKVRTKEGTSNLYQQVVEQQLNATSGALAHGGIELAALETALKALDDYEYVLEDAVGLISDTVGAESDIKCPVCGGWGYEYEETPCSDHPDLETWTVECNNCDHKIDGAPDRDSAVAEFEKDLELI
jgi:curved DNA-binding protein CbpA